MQPLIYRVWLWREWSLRDSRSHAPREVISKLLVCLRMTTLYIAALASIPSHLVEQLSRLTRATILAG